MNERELVVLGCLVFLVAIGIVVLGMWLLVSGIVGVTQDGATGWNVFKIVLGAMLLLGSRSSRKS